MFSLNVPIPPAVERIADDLQPRLVSFDRVRERHTLVCKRIGVDDLPVAGRAPHKDRALAALREELRPLLAGTAPIDLRIAGIDAFERPAQGPGPVVYLAVESDALRRLHRRLCGAFDPVDGIEGDDYVPHVTLARGGDRDAVERLLAADVEPVSWTASELDVYDPEFREVAATVPLRG
ncbi:2'-5' RNA ligase family protein [Haloparvum alkalitolerans]|uniref:2'-5' RNA ligase family protein n=1 Tax=Haloparvum alkalitolerans TaxID=1042953 RepID=UPI003CFA1168